jgi:thiamine pyrophosphokinase
LGVLAAMFNPTLAKIDVEAIWNDSQLFALQGPKSLTFSANIGDLVGIQSFSDISKKITTTGLRWPLKGEQLTNHETRGVSNEANELKVSISLEAGQLLIARQLITRQLIQKIKQ